MFRPSSPGPCGGDGFPPVVDEPSGWQDVIIWHRSDSMTNGSSQNRAIIRTRGIVRHLVNTHPIQFPTASTSSETSDMAATQAIPRWKSIAQEGIAKAFKDGEKGSVLYQALSTVDPGPPPVPHVRYVVHRGFVNEQRSKETKSGVEPFDKAWEGSRSLVLSTTDIRAPKALEMIKAAEQSGEGSRGEIVWWQESSQIQLRLNGVYHLLPTASHPLAKSFPRQRLAPLPAQGSSDSEQKKTFDWAKERSRQWEKLSPSLLASFVRPTPSGPHPHNDKFKAFGQGEGAAEGEDSKDEVNQPWPQELPPPDKAETEEQKRQLAESEKNFALIVFEPFTVDVVDLARDKRSFFERVGNDPNGEWKESRRVP
ncbi:unnamed protein product [Parajaminaea phylloscopi]